MAVDRTEAFREWLAKLRDKEARGRIVRRLQRLEAGNPGDVAPVGEGVSELRLDYGPGYRIYYIQRGDVATVLWGGTKKTQYQDIEKAKDFARNR